MSKDMQEDKEEEKKSTVADDFQTGEALGEKDAEEDKTVADTNTSDEKSV